MAGFSGLLAVLFIGLKLTGFISWSWVWVLAPIWAGLAIALAVFLIGLIVVAYSSAGKPRKSI